MEKKKVTKKPINKKEKKTTNKTTKKLVKSSVKKTSSKKKKGFTLIELLAVIIILGILMIIAIPSVTKYISDSRKSAYIDTAKEIVAGTRNIVNEGKLGMYDTNTTYYIPAKYVNTENSLKSPYGEFTDTSAYVGVIFDGQGYKYYWISVDDAGQGIDNVTPLDKLDTDLIKSDLKTDEIFDKVKTTGIGERTSIKVLNLNGVWENYSAFDNIDESGSTNSSGYTGYAYLYDEWGSGNLNTKLDNERKTIWCPVLKEEEYYYCAIGNDAPSTEEECNEEIQNYSNPQDYKCESRERLYDSNLRFYELNKIPYYRPYYIKMYIKNDVLKSAEVCFIFDKDYCLKAGDEGAAYSENVEILRSVQSRFSNCTFDETQSRCSNSGDSMLNSITIGSGGNVSVYNSYASGCYVNGDSDAYVICHD